MQATVYISTGSWYIVKNSKGELLNARLKGRRNELSGGGKRWGCIPRLALEPVLATGGKPKTMANVFSNIAVYNGCPGSGPAPSIAALPYADYRFIWPIPQDDINTNPIISQNPLY